MANTGGRNYMANLVGAPQIIQGTPNYNVEVSEGQVPPGEFYPAGYLPVTQSENRIADWFRWARTRFSRSTKSRYIFRRTTRSTRKSRHRRNCALSRNRYQ